MGICPSYNKAGEPMNTHCGPIEENVITNVLDIDYTLWVIACVMAIMICCFLLLKCVQAMIMFRRKRKESKMPKPICRRFVVRHPIYLNVEELRLQKV